MHIIYFYIIGCDEDTCGPWSNCPSGCNVTKIQTRTCTDTRCDMSQSCSSASESCKGLKCNIKNEFFCLFFRSTLHNRVTTTFRPTDMYKYVPSGKSRVHTLGFSPLQLKTS